MATTYYNDIQKLYVAYFNRPADVGGLKFWEQTLEANKGDIASVAAQFAKQTEYTDTFKGMTSAQIVDQVYKNLFGRPAEDGGKKFYGDLLDAGKLTIDQVVLEVAKGAQGNSDGIIFQNKVSAATAFTAALDTDAEAAAYTTASVPQAKAFIAGITTGATLDAALLPANLNKVVGDFVAKGTTFTVTGALGSLNAANAAYKAFLTTADGDADANTSATHASLVTAQTTAEGKATALLTGTRGTDYAATSSAAAKAALLSEQTAAYATDIATLQDTAAKSAAAVAKVAGLTAAVAARDAANTALDAATKADLNATAALKAQVTSYNTVHAGATTEITVAADGTAKINGATVIKLDAGKLVLESGITEADYAGITALLNASQSLETADKTLANATTAQAAAVANVHHLDQTADEVTDLAKLAADIGLAVGTQPTEAQLTTYAAANPGDATFAADLATYRGHYTTDPLVATYDTDAKNLKDATKASADFNTAVTKLNAATATLNTELGLKASVDAAAKLFTNAGYTYTDIDTAGATIIASADSDVLVAGKANSSISLFGLSGKDVVSIGTGYTVNTGKLSTGVDTTKEVFIHTASNGTDAEIQIESHAYSGSVANATAPELVTITLVGVDAAKLVLDANTGIISLS